MCFNQLMIWQDLQIRMVIDRLYTDVSDQTVIVKDLYKLYFNGLIIVISEYLYE